MGTQALAARPAKAPSRQCFWRSEGHKGWNIEYPVIVENGAFYTPLMDWEKYEKCPSGPALGD